MALQEQLAEFERRVAARLADAVDEMRRSLHAQAERASTQMLTDLDSFKPEMPGRLIEETELQGLSRPTREETRGELAREIKSALAALDAAPTQAAALDALLAATRGGAHRAAVWLVEESRLVGWGSVGFATNGVDPLAGAALAFDRAPALTLLARGRGTVRLAADDAARLASELEIEAPHAAALVPLVLRDHLAAALYVDRVGDDAGELELELIQLLTHATAQRLELQPLSARSHSPTLVLDDEAPAGTAGLPLWDPAAFDVEAPAAASGFAPQPEVEAAPALDDTVVPLFAEPESVAELGIAPGLELPESYAGFEPVELPAEVETLYESEPESDTLAELTPAVQFGHPELDAAPSERFVLLAPAAPAAAEPSAAEIAWEMEEVESAAPAAPEPHSEEATTGRIPIFSAPSLSPIPPLPALDPLPPFDEPAPFQREIRPESPVIESTAEFLPPVAPIPPMPPLPPLEPPPFSPAAGLGGLGATQAIRPDSVATHEFALPGAVADADTTEDATLMIGRSESPAPRAPLAPPPSAASTVALPLSPAFDLPAAALAPPAPLAPAAPISPVAPPDDEPTVSRAKTTEVVPPPDIQGPGWAFTSSRAQRPTGENALHEEARRLARLLISEIKLYNEEQVEEGRRNRDVYHRLKDDIDRSRQIYEERVHESVRGTTDYFQQELVRSLAGGDARALGI